MKIHKIAVDLTDQAALDKAFARVEAQPVACCNWPKEFAYAPRVQFRMFHTGERLMLRFDVAEQYTAARVTQDNGEVWTDSCVEFFIKLDDTGYYNFETTCIGRMLLGFRQSRTEAVHASAQVLATIHRQATLGSEPFEEREGDNRWSLTLGIPAGALFAHKLKTWDGVQATMNLYKCGDKLSHPHFLSWKPIDTPTPDFHRPEFFTPVDFGQ